MKDFSISIFLIPLLFLIYQTSPCAKISELLTDFHFCLSHLQFHAIPLLKRNLPFKPRNQLTMHFAISTIPLLTLLVFSAHAQDDKSAMRSDFTAGFGDARSVFGGAAASSDSSTSALSPSTSSASNAIFTTSSIDNEAISTSISPAGGVVCYGPAACTKAHTSATSTATSTAGNEGEISCNGPGACTNASSSTTAVSTGGVAMVTAVPMWGAAAMGAALYLI